jgi:phage-related protein
MAVRGSIEIPVVADTSKVARRLQAELQAAIRGITVPRVVVDGDTDPLIRRVREAEAEVDKSFSGLWARIKSQATTAGSGIGSALAKGLIAAVASGIGPAIASATALVASFGPAILATATAGAGAMITLKVATLGVGDALKEVGSDQEKFDEAIKSLSPNAQKFAQSIRGVLPQLKGLKDAVQDRFFQGLDKDVKDVTKTLLGPAKTGMTAVSGTLNGIVRQITSFAKSAKGAEVVNTIFEVTNVILTRISGVFGPLLNNVGEWIIKAGDSGVNSMLNTTKETIVSLANAAKNVGSALGSLFGGLDKDGPAVAASLEEATKAVKDFLASAQAQEVLATLGNVMDRVRGIALQILEVLPSLLPAVNGLATGGFGVLLTVVEGLVSALAPVADALGGQEELFTAIGIALGTYVVALKAYQTYQVLATTAQVAWKAATIASNIVTTAATAIYNSTRVALLLLQTGYYAAGAAVTTASTAIWAQVSALAATAAAWARNAAAAALNTVRLVAYVVATNAVKAATIAWTAVQWLLNAAMTANPIGIVIAIIVALVAAIIIAYKNSETFRAIVDAAFKAIGAAAMWLWENALKPLWDGIVAGFEFVKAAAALWWTGVQAYFALLGAAATTLWGWIKTAWAGIVAAFNFVVEGASRFVSMVIGFFSNLVSAVSQRVSSLISFVTGIPGRVLGAIGNLGSLLYNAGANIIQGLINGVTSMIGRLTSTVSGAVQRIRDFLPFSPAKTGPLSGAGAPERSGARIAEGIATGIEGQRGALESAMNNVMAGLRPPTVSLNGYAPGGDGASAEAPGGVRVWPSQNGAGNGSLIRIESSGTPVDDLLVEVLSNAIRVRGGNVEKVLGKGTVGVS